MRVLGNRVAGYASRLRGLTSLKRGCFLSWGPKAGGPGCSLRLYDGTRKQTAGCWEEASTYTMVLSLYLHTSVLTLAILRAYVRLNARYSNMQKTEGGTLDNLI